MKDDLYCDFCGTLVRQYGTIYRHYGFRWWSKWRVCICNECESKLPKEVKEDKPAHWRHNVNPS